MSALATHSGMPAETRSVSNRATPDIDISAFIADALGDFRAEAPQPLVELHHTADPVAVPHGCCPKCIGPRPETAVACPSCGLVYERFHLSQVAPQDALLNAFVWLQVEGAPVEEHSRLLARAELLGELPRVLRLYRIVQVREPNHPTVAQVLADAVKIASAPLAVAPPPPKSRLQRNLALGLMLAVFLAAVTIQTVSALR